MKKLITITLTLAFMVTGVAVVNADEVEDLQTELDSILEQIEALEGDTADDTADEATVPAACEGVTFTKNLSEGDSGSDVECLQALLNQDPATQVAEDGVGSAGNETEYFGILTKSAVINFQAQYEEEILAPVGLTAGTGYVGPSTRAQLNEMLDAGVASDSSDDDVDSDTLAEITAAVEALAERVNALESPTLAEDAEEGELKASIAPEPVGVEVYQGQSKDVAAFELESKDADINVQRMDVVFNDENAKPWDVMDSVALYDGDTKLGEIDASRSNFTELDNEDDYPGSFTGNVYRLRLSGLALTVAKDSTKDIAVRVNAPSVIDSADQGIFEVGTAKDGVRYVDGTDVVERAQTSDVETFEIIAEDVASLSGTRNSDSPDTGVVLVDDEETTRDIELLDFDVESEDVASTIEDVNVTVNDASSVVSYVRLYDGDTLLDREGAGTNFEDLEVEIGADQTKTLTLKVDVQALASANEGAEVSVAVDSVAGIDDNDNDVSKSIDVTSKSQYVYTTVPSVSLVDAELSKVVRDSGDDEAEGSIEFDITAEGDDVYIGQSDDGITGIEMDTSFTNITPAYAVEIDGDYSETENSNWKISKGDTATVTVDIGMTEEADGTDTFGRVYVDNVNWNTDDSDSDYSDLNLPELVSDVLRTGNVRLVD